MHRHIQARRRIASLLSSALTSLSSACSGSAVQGGDEPLPSLDGGAGFDARSTASDGRSAPSDGSERTTGCNQLEVMFESRTPTVFILVDRSSSMFEQARWEPLKLGVLSMVQRLQDEVRFGFSSYTGQNGGTCPDLTTFTSFALNNYDKIDTAYSAVAAPTYKGETPTSRALDNAASSLVADPDVGPKFILLVTDGEPDFCDDGNVTCARDAVVASAQAAHAKGVGTFIVSIGGGVDQNHLRDVANAGSGQSVEDRGQAVKNQCQGGTASYAAPAGMAPFFEPDVNDQQLLVDQLSSVVFGTRSCLFDLQGKIEIDLRDADTGVVLIDGVGVPYGTVDGYRMNSATQLELLGASCQRLKQPSAQAVSIQFPCEAVIPI